MRFSLVKCSLSIDTTFKNVYAICPPMYVYQYIINHTVLYILLYSWNLEHNLPGVLRSPTKRPSKRGQAGNSVHYAISGSVKVSEECLAPLLGRGASVNEEHQAGIPNTDHRLSHRLKKYVHTTMVSTKGNIRPRLLGVKGCSTGIS